MKASKKVLNGFEGIGLILLLISFGIQLEEDSIQDDVREAQYYNTQKKLDALWSVTSTAYEDSHDVDVHMAIDFESIVKNWKIYSEDKKELDKWQRLVAFQPIANSRIVFFLAGSILLVLPKFISEKRK